MRRFLGVLVISLVLVLAYAFFQRQRQAGPPVNAVAEARMALVCAAYYDARAHAQLDTSDAYRRRIRREADSLCTAFAAGPARGPEGKLR